MSEDRTCTAFQGERLLASGARPDVAAAVHAALQAGAAHVLIFDDATGEQLELDLRADPPAIAGRSPPPKPGRGRPKLGVVPKEVTLLPRHWDWLAQQPGGASAALRRLVEDASRSGADGPRQRQEAVYKAMSALAGNLPGYEEATRALFAGDRQRFENLICDWPEDISRYLASRILA
jgi:uncharacterized protein